MSQNIHLALCVYLHLLSQSTATLNSHVLLHPIPSTIVEGNSRTFFDYESLFSPYKKTLSTFWNSLVEAFTGLTSNYFLRPSQTKNTDASLKKPSTAPPTTTKVPKFSRPSSPWWASANGIIVATGQQKPTRWKKVPVKRKRKPTIVPIIRRHRSTTTTTTMLPTTVTFPHDDVHVVDEYYSNKFNRLANLLAVVRFKNEICRSYDGRRGTCFHALECKSFHGTASGYCAKGFGVCCIFEKTCGDVIKHNCSYFVSPKQNNNSYVCTLIIHKLNPHVNHIRLDFNAFELQGPSNGTCLTDQFIVSGQNVNSVVPVICGSNTGSHVYIDADSSPGPLRLTVMTNPDSIPRSWRIKVTQYDLWRPSGVPAHCLQHHSNFVGVIQSFNYNVGSQQYFNNLNYAICIRKERGFCSITYTNMDSLGNAYPFQIVNRDEAGMPSIPPGQAGIGVRDCPDDFIIVNGARLCGDVFNDASSPVPFDQNAPVTDVSQGPFVIPVRSNAMNTGLGFRLFYKQNPCMMQLLG